MSYTVTAVKGTRKAKTISAALIAAASEELYDSAGGFSVENDATGDIHSFDLILGDHYGDQRIAVEDVQELARLAGVDPRADDNDGLHWPYAPRVSEAADALDRFVSSKARG